LRLFVMQSLIAVSFFAFRRHGKYVLCVYGFVAFALARSLLHLPVHFATIMYVPYLVCTLSVLVTLSAFAVMNERSFIAARENQDLKDIEIAALTQISHVIKNKLNYVESVLPEWKERIRTAKVPSLDDVENDFGTMQYCVQASLAAVGHVHTLRAIKVSPADGRRHDDVAHPQPRPRLLLQQQLLLRRYYNDYSPTNSRFFCARHHQGGRVRDRAGRHAGRPMGGRVRHQPRHRSERRRPVGARPLRRAHRGVRA